jgi:YHS domain-containing protein
MMSGPADTGQMHCIKMGNAYDKPSEIVDYKGVRYGTCCAGCAASFIADPETMLKAAHDKDLMVGTCLFDPVSGARVVAKDDTPLTRRITTTFYFTSTDDKAKFDADPDKYMKAPDKELLHCPVLDSDIKDYASAGGFVDYKGVRYYVCCTDCLATIRKDPAKYADKFADKASACKPENQTK